MYALIFFKMQQTCGKIDFLRDTWVEIFIEIPVLVL